MQEDRKKEKKTLNLSVSSYFMITSLKAKKKMQILN